MQIPALRRRLASLFLLALVLFVAAASCLHATSADDDVAGEDALGDRESALGPPVRVRVMAANITSGTGQSYDPGHGTRIFQGVDPDVVLIQELNYGSNSAADIRAFVDTAFGTTFSYYRESGAQIPNGIISRYPIIASGEWNDPSVSNRDFAWAQIDVPGPVDLYAVSVHFLTSSSSSRNTEAQNLVAYIQQQVPAGAYLVVGGDLNTGSRGESCVSKLAQVVVTSSPYPADRNGNTNTNAGRDRPYDWLLADPDLNAYKTSVTIGGSVFTNGLVADTRVYSPLSEISPALSGDSGASGMQHMGVVRDFLIPGDAAAGTVALTSPNGGESWLAGSAHAVTWTAADVASVRLDYTLDGAAWTEIVASTSASSGSFTWTLPQASSTTARVRVRDVADASVTDQSDGPFSIGSAGPAVVRLNEIRANEPGSDPAGEIVELVNSGSTAAGIGGWTIADAVGTRHTFAAGTTIPAGAAVVVFGGAIAIPPGLANAIAASTGALGLSNSGDTVTLRDDGTTIVDTFTYTSTLSSNDGVSMNRSPDGSPTGSFVLHTTLAASGSSPGVRVSGAAFP